MSRSCLEACPYIATCLEANKESAERLAAIQDSYPRVLLRNVELQFGETPLNLDDTPELVSVKDQVKAGGEELEAALESEAVKLAESIANRELEISALPVICRDRVPRTQRRYLFFGPKDVICRGIITYRYHKLTKRLYGS